MPTSSTSSSSAPSAAPLTFWQRMVRLQNPLMKWLLQSPLHSMISGSYLLITFRGRKSGSTYATPVQYAQDGTTLHIITSRKYVWWKNLPGSAPVSVMVLLRGRKTPAQATASTDEAAVRNCIEKLYPQMSAERKADLVANGVAVIIKLKALG